MSAIAGFVDLPGDEKTQLDMLQTMTCRGGDKQGAFRRPGCTLLHACGGLPEAQAGQPLAVCRGGREYEIVWDGALYNADRLGRELASLGHHLKGTGDGEIALHAYMEWGTACLDRFSGMFGLGIWDRSQQTLLLARDRLGIKPLFYTESQGGIIFASEMKTILAYPTMQARLDRQGAAELVLLGPGRVPGSGVLQGIRELKPGHCGIYCRGAMKEVCWWRLRDREHRENQRETAQQIRWLVKDSIEMQTKGRGPVGSCLSGGLDSSLISAVCAGTLADAGQRLSTFSVDYEGQDRYFSPSALQPENDSAYIRRMVRAMDADHHQIVLTADQLSGALEEAVLARDLPGMGDVDASLLLFCREIRKTVPAALSGEGADEIFGGYPWFREQPDVHDFPWARNAAQRQKLLHPAWRGEALTGYVRQCCEESIRQCDLLPEQPEEEKRKKILTDLNLRWFFGTLADRNDRMSAHAGLEMRVPLCDHRIVSYVYGIPWSMKAAGGREKGLLRLAMEGILPEEVLWRKKSPYPKTYDPRYGALVEEKLRALMQDPHAPLFDLLDRTAVERMLEQEQPGPWYGQLMGRPQTMAWLLQTDFWLRRYQVELIS